jgi:hypothetical protein
VSSTRSPSSSKSLTTVRPLPANSTRSFTDASVPVPGRFAAAG